LHKFLANSYSTTLASKRTGDIIKAASGKRREYDLVEYHRINEEQSTTYREIYERHVNDYPELRVLSLGCGTTEPAYAREMGIKHVTFVDLALPEAAYLKYPEVLRLDRNYTHLPAESFDVVVSVLSMFKLDFPRSIGEMVRLLAPGGRTLIVESYNSTKRGGKGWVNLGIAETAAHYGLEVLPPKQLGARLVLIEVRKGASNGKAEAKVETGW
jgi:SAM-dependent methyltransferase